MTICFSFGSSSDGFHVVGLFWDFHCSRLWCVCVCGFFAFSFVL